MSMYSPNKVCKRVRAPFCTGCRASLAGSNENPTHCVYVHVLPLCDDTSSKGVFKCFINHFLSWLVCAREGKQTHTKMLFFLHHLQGNINEGKLRFFFSFS